MRHFKLRLEFIIDENTTEMESNIDGYEWMIPSDHFLFVQQFLNFIRCPQAVIDCKQTEIERLQGEVKNLQDGLEIVTKERDEFLY